MLLVTDDGSDAALDREGRKVPLYLQVAQLVRQRIYYYRYVDSLPAESELAAEFGVSTSVIRNALAKLREEGLVMTRHGVGSTVAQVPDRVEVRCRKGDTVSSGMPAPATREQLGLPPGVPVLIVVHRDGSRDVYDSLRTLIVF